jgi:hypothetical protein
MKRPPKVFNIGRAKLTGPKRKAAKPIEKNSASLRLNKRGPKKSLKLSSGETGVSQAASQRPS